MNTTTRLIDLELAKRGLYRLPDETQQVTVRAGTLWITQDNDPRDIILEPGQSFTPDAHRQVILYALAAAAVTVHTSARTPTPAHKPHRSTARELVLE